MKFFGKMFALEWIKDGLSLDETKISALIISFFLTLGVSFYQVFYFGDITENVLTLLGYQLMAFTGIKVAENLTTKNKDRLDPYENRDVNKLP